MTDILTLCQCSDLRIIDKPSKMAVLAAPGSGVPSIEAAMPEWRAVHRLDNDTSGCLLLAKTETLYHQLRTLFDERAMTKEYHARVHGLTPASATIATRIAHHPSKRDRMVVVANDDVAHRGKSREAITTCTTLHHSHPTATHPDPTSLVHILIATGVRHQIRVHLNSIGHAIVGDGIYGKQNDGRPRHLLHASRLSFTHPKTNAVIDVSSPVPEVIQNG